MILRPIGILLCTAGLLQAATTLSVMSSADAYLSSANPNTNFGNAGALSLAGNGAGNAVGPLASILRFDLSTVTSTLNSTYGVGGWVLESVQVQLTSATPLNPNFNPNAAGSVAVDWLTSDSWAEGTVTWAGLPAVLGGGVQSMGNFNYGGSSSGTVAYGIQTNAGFIGDLLSGSLASLLLSAGDPNVSMTINSRNFGTPASRPYLLITASAVPEPSKTALFLLGVLAVALRRQR